MPPFLRPAEPAELLNKAEKVMMKGRRYWEVTLLIHDRPGSLGRIAAVFGERGIQIRSVNMRSIAPDKGK